MATIARVTKASGGTAFLDGTTAYGSEVETDFNTVYTAWNNIDGGTSSWSFLKVGGTTTLSDNLIFSPTTKGVKGTTTNDATATGNVGEYVSSVATDTAFSSSTTWADLTSISLTAGDWDVTALIDAYTNGGTITSWFFGIGTSAGNVDPSGSGDHRLGLPPLTSSTPEVGSSIPQYRMSLAVTTTVYLKFVATYSVATPHCTGRISARRVR